MKKSVFWTLALSVVALAIALFYLFFVSIPYYVIFITANFFFLYVAVVYLLKYWEAAEAKKKFEYPRVSIIVPAYNSGKTIIKSIESVLALDYPSKPQIIVVNDASKDDTLKKILSLKKKGGFVAINNKINKGKAASLNQALKHCKGELVACIDSDTYPAPDALTKMVEQFYDKRVGASIALVCVNEPKTFVQKVQEIEYFVAFGFWHTCLARLNGLLVTPGPMSVYSKKALQEIGGFDEKNITEDMEIALNLHQHNYKIVCTTEAKIYTEVPATLPKLFKQRLRWSRGKIFNGRKYFHMLFNSKYNDFGKFVYPISFVVEFLSLVVVARIFFLYAEAVVKAVTSFINISEVETGLLYNLQLYDTVTINSSVFFMVTTLILWAYIIWLSFRIAREGVKLTQVPAIVVFMLFYSIFISTTYFASMVHEIIGSEAQW